MLCGIISRFQLLSPSERQIAHVLLTRPPLSYLKQAPNNSVRLACVKRAASVRPEPGSNSLVKLYPNSLSRFMISVLHCRVFCIFQSLLDFLLLVSSKQFTRVLCFSLLFNFQDTVAPFLKCSSIISHFFRFVKRFFEIFSISFFHSLAVSVRRLIYLTTFSPACQAFF